MTLSFQKERNLRYGRSSHLESLLSGLTIYMQKSLSSSAASWHCTFHYIIARLNRMESSETI